ncbi:MAG TPA: NrfD/PsrC family molybdoenzyme membrane anchor subunit, partial [Armatimonadota bacterium]|nr:NrfD/PsrC family molybdoenzyme membrane anchor subunit [Armatimonadota bacterium]
MTDLLRSETVQEQEPVIAELTYPQVLPPAEVPEPVEQVVQRTAFRASLPAEYEWGQAPAGQRRQDQHTPERPDYYGLPAIKRPEWKWYVPAYFFTGGVASGSYIVATIADMRGGGEDRPLVRAGRYLCLLMTAACPVLLIADLGRPERWHYMLRSFRPRSMMNQGAWGLSLFGAFVTAATVAQVLEDLAGGGNGLGRRLLRGAAAPLRPLTWLGIPVAAYVGSYTGVLLSATNVPLWAGNRNFLGPLFFASALSSGV